MRATGLSCLVLFIALSASLVFGQAQAPEQFDVDFHTTEGDFRVHVQRSLAPLGADRFYQLVQANAFGQTDDASTWNGFFRVVPDFIVQFGIHGDPKVSALYRNANIRDDPVQVPNSRGTITFATAGANTRTSQLFINFADNSFLDSSGFAPFGQVVSGMEVVDRLYSGYAETPDQHRVQFEGNRYLSSHFPNLDYITSASIVQA